MGGPSEHARPAFSEAWLVAVLDSLVEGVLALDEGGRLVAANPAAETLLGFSLATARYAHWSTLAWAHLVHEDGRTVASHPLRRCVEQGREVAPEVVGLDLGEGVRWLTLAAHRLTGEGIAETGTVVSIQDVTDRVEAEHDLHRVLGLLRDVFSATTHDLRGPLTSIQGYSQLLLDGWDKHPQEERDLSLEAIVRQTQHLTRLVADLSVVAGLEAGGIVVNPEVVAVADLVASALEGTAGAAVEVSVDPDLQVRVDLTHGRRMVGNLVDNAAKYGAPPIRVEGRREGRDTLVVVADAGSGVPDRFVPELFDRFTRGAPGGDTPGSGLGLAIVAGLAQRNGGTVTYRPGPRGGAEFTLRLPAGGAGVDPVHLVHDEELAR